MKHPTTKPGITTVSMVLSDVKPSHAPRALHRNDVTTKKRGRPRVEKQNESNADVSVANEPT